MPTVTYGKPQSSQQYQKYPVNGIDIYLDKALRVPSQGLQFKLGNSYNGGKRITLEELNLNQGSTCGI